MAVANSRISVTVRPPMRSARMPAGRRHIEPFKTATAEIQLNSTSLSPNSCWIGTPRMPNISQTANISVNAMVDITRTRPAPLAVVWSGPTTIRGVDMCGLLQT